MSKVYSFRLSENNPREAQAREVINAWVEQGYSLRHVMIEALLCLENKDSYSSEINEVLNQLRDMIVSGGLSHKILDKSQKEGGALPTSFIEAIQKNIKGGVGENSINIQSEEYFD